MLKSKFIDLLKLRLGSREDSDMDALIMAEAGQVQDELEAGDFIPWFLYGTQDITTIAGTQAVTLPTGFINFFNWDEDPVLLLDDGDGNLSALEMNGLTRLQLNYGVEADMPERFAQVTDEVLLFPTPDDVYSLTVNGFFKDTAFDAVAMSAQNQWLTHAGDWLLAVTGGRIARYIKDSGAAAAFGLDAQAAYSRVKLRHQVWEMNARDRLIIGA